MAMSINSSPVLTGESAIAFWEEAEKKTNYPNTKLTVEREEELQKIEKESKEFADYLMKKING